MLPHLAKRNLHNLKFGGREQGDLSIRSLPGGDRRKQSRMIDKKLEPGIEITPVVFELDESVVREYIAVVGATAQAHQLAQTVPTMAVAALGMRAVLQGLSLPHGTIHLGHEHTSNRAVQVGERLTCNAKVIRRSERGDGVFIVVEFGLSSNDGEPVVDGRATVMTPKNDE